MGNYQKKIALVLVYHHNSDFCDGASIFMFEVAQWLQKQGNKICVYTFINYDPCSLYEDKFLGNIGKYMEVNQKIIPFSKKKMESQTEQGVLKLVMETIQSERIEYVITCDSDFISLLAVSILGIPGAHFFNFLDNIHLYVTNPSYIRFLKKRDIFGVSRFIQKSIKRILGLEAEICYPILNLKSYKIEKNYKITDAVGYYSSGRHKGDDIVNILIQRMPQVKFIIMGKNYTHPFKELPNNLKFLGEITDNKLFYEQIKILLAPSLVAEGFSRVILEAAVNGIPVIANRIGGIPEAAGKSSILIDVIDSTEKDYVYKLLENYMLAIQRLLGDERLYSHYRQKALKHAKAFMVKQEERFDYLYQLFFIK